ncbi:MAG: Dabb family protein [Verrucomicrobiota bacterium]
MSKMLHSVYFWLREDLNAEDRQKFAQALDKLGEIDVVAEGHYGSPAATPDRAPVTDHSFDFSLFLSFNSIEDHDTYQIHPDHQVFVDGFNSYWTKVQVLDSTLH